MAQEAEEGQGDDGGADIKDWTGKTPADCDNSKRQELGRTGENLCVVLRSLTFSNEDGKRRRYHQISSSQQTYSKFKDSLI